MSKRKLMMAVAMVGGIASFVSMLWAVVDDDYIQAFFFLTLLLINAFGYYAAKEDY